jgi:hypothetical protein
MREIRLSGSEGGGTKPIVSPYPYGARKQVPLLPVIAVAPSGLDYLRWLTQGSQSLALGLTLAAATQLAEGSRLTSSSYD